MSLDNTKFGYIKDIVVDNLVLCLRTKFEINHFDTQKKWLEDMGLHEVEWQRSP